MVNAKVLALFVVMFIVVLQVQSQFMPLPRYMPVHACQYGPQQYCRSEQERAACAKPGDCDGDKPAKKSTPSSFEDNHLTYD